jgi:DNA-directed RNA polymerase specialized sigma24 family protein
LLARDRPDDPDPDSPCDLDPHPKVAAQAAALEAIFRASYDGLFAAAFRFLRSRPLAEEVVQDVFATMWERRDRWGEGELVDLRRYLFGAVQNRAISLLRRERVRWRTRSGWTARWVIWRTASAPPMRRPRSRSSAPIGSAHRSLR